MTEHSGKAYRFTFDASTGAVDAVFEIEHGRTEREDIDQDETWSRDPATGHVVHREWEHGRQEVTTYADTDGDGFYARTGPSQPGDRPDDSHGPHTEDAHAGHGAELSGHRPHPVIDADLAGWLLQVLQGAARAPAGGREPVDSHAVFPDADAHAHGGGWGDRGTDDDGHAPEAASGLPMLWHVLLVGMAAIGATDWHP